MKKKITLLVLCTQLLVFSQTVVINEVVTDPQQDWSSNDFNGTTGNGPITTTDEWLELYIKTDGLDLTGWTIELIDGSDIVGSLTNTGAFDESIYISSSGGTFTNTQNGDFLVLGNPDGTGAMNNSITINLKNNLGTIIDTVTLGGATNEAFSGNSGTIGDEAVYRLPNGTDTNTHNTDFTKGMATIGTANTIGFYWDGSLSSDWSHTSNWATGVLPGVSDHVFIPDVTNAPEINTNTTTSIGNLTISNTDGLSILGGTLTVSGDITISSGSSLYLASTITAAKTIDAATLILEGNYISDTNQFFYFTETFNDNSEGWTLISSPTIGEVIDGGVTGFAGFNNLKTSESNNYGIASYNNAVISANRWNYFTTTEIAATNNILMTSGKGYAVLPNATLNSDTAKGNLGFKGEIPTTDIQISLTNNSGGMGNAFNLIGNPFPSFIPINSLANTTNILSENSSELAEETLWLWDKATGTYATINQTTTLGNNTHLNQRPSLYIAPTQGFFVKTKTGGGNFTFPKSIQTHQTTGTYNKSQNTRAEIQLQVSQNNTTKNTMIYYYDNKTTDFDNGYDSSLFTDRANDLEIYTKLVAGNQDKNLAIQTLPNVDFENMVIPIVVKATTDKEITFSAAQINLPKGINVFLEDKVKNTYTSLNNATIKYTTTLNTNITENRFYIHTKKSSVLNIEKELLNTISIYTINNKTLRILGLEKGKNFLKIYNVLGKQVLSTSFNKAEKKDILLPQLESGMYLIQLVTEKGTVHKKITLD